MPTQDPALQREEQIVVELERLGVRYLSRQAPIAAPGKFAPVELLAELIRQPSSRVRAALIALLLAHPEYALHVPAALKRLVPPEAESFKVFYTAAVLLQEQYAAPLRVYLNRSEQRWKQLPDLFSGELHVTGSTAPERLKSLGQIHAQRTGIRLNWTGSFENAARHLLRRWDLEGQWSR